MSQFEPGDPVSFYDTDKKCRTGRYIRTITKGRRKGQLVIHLVEKTATVPLDRVRSPTTK